MNLYLSIKVIHIISSFLLVGTGFGTAFYLFRANRSHNLAAQAVVSRDVVLADWIFTTPTVVIQPLTGWWLATQAGWPLSTPWISISIALYCFAGLCWLPVVWLQVEMQKMAADAFIKQETLPARYWRFSCWWERLGYPAFIAMLIVITLMVTKPDTLPFL